MTDWKRGRVVECTGLENRRGFAPIVSSNLTASASIAKAPRVALFFRKLQTGLITRDIALLEC
jgi:hypothetical protein